MAPTHREKTTTVTARDVAVITERIARDGDGDWKAIGRRRMRRIGA